MTRPSFLLPDAIEHHARFSPRDIAVVCEGERLTWHEFELASRKLANAFIARGVTKGDRVCIYMASSLIAFVTIWAAIRAGGVVGALNTQLQGTALAETINDADPRLILADPALADQLWTVWDDVRALSREQVLVAGGGAGSIEALAAAAADAPIPVTIEPEDSISIVYSSGSTGKPKGAEHSHAARLAFVAGIGPMMGIVDRHAVTLVTTPLCTNGTWITMAPTIFRGGRIVIAPKFSPQAFCELVEAEGCTHAFMVPTQYIGIVGFPGIGRYGLSSLTGLLSAGQPLLSATYEAMLAQFPGARIYEAYGMSEGFGTMATPEDFARGKRGTVGKPFFLDDIAILGPDGEMLPAGGVGEIAGWSAGMMKGYFRDPERTAAAIWQDGQGRRLLRSGDLGYLDEDGFLFISGRVKDMIKSGGFNIFASDIEAVFIAHPDVREVAVVGIPHEKWGETPHLFAIARDGAAIDGEALLAWGNDRLAKFQRVSSIQFCEDFPRAQYGKINKTALRAPFWAGRERST